jgi:hypothetical protein
MLKNVNPNKSTNCEDWPAWITKAACEDLCVPVTDIFYNCMLATNTYPNVWKTAEIRPLKKTKNPEKPSDYRPISLLHHLGKIAAEVILQRSQSSLGDKLDKNQYAYQRNLSTTDALLDVIHNWCLELDDLKTSHVSSAFVDMSKAFDKMDPNILMNKLKCLRVEDGLVALIDNFLTNRKCCVKLKEKSKYRAITMGAPQGTKLGPWLWLVYVNDLSASCSIMKYADDVTLYAPFMKKTSNAENFQVSLDEVSQWAQDNNMLINAKKTQLIQFTLSEPKYVDH